MTDPTDDRVPAEFWQELAKAAAITSRRERIESELAHVTALRNIGVPADRIVRTYRPATEETA